MAKKPAKKSWDSDMEVSAADFFSIQMEDVVAKLGRNDIFVGSEAQRVVIGLPLRAFCLRWGFMNDIYPLSRMVEIYGVSESLKTAMMFEFFRWHLYGAAIPMNPTPEKELKLVGAYSFNLAEPRDSPDLRASIVGHDIDIRFPVQQCNAIEDWMDNTTSWLRKARDTFSDIGAMPFAAAIGVDSLTGVATRDEIAKIWASGHAEINFAKAANLINTYCKFVFNEIRCWPISFLGTNHMKGAKNSQGFMEWRVPGGASLDYYATFKIRMKRKDDVEHLDDYGRIVQMTWDKNSLSPAGERRTLEVFMRWYFDDNRLQHTYWDWHDASVALLTTFDGARKTRIADIVNIEGVNKATRRATCTQLGLKNVAWAEIGAAIEDDDSVREGLDKLFGIRKRREFRSGVPYIQQVQEAMKAGDDTEEPHNSSEVPPIDAAPKVGWGGVAVGSSVPAEEASQVEKPKPSRRVVGKDKKK